jgi:hypothetical protein
MILVMLLHEGHQRIERRAALGIGGEQRPVAEVPPAADHRQVDAHQPAPLDGRQHIHVLVLGALDELLVEHGLQVADLVAVGGGLLEGQAVGGLLHAPRQIIHHVVCRPPRNRLARRTSAA